MAKEYEFIKVENERTGDWEYNVYIIEKKPFPHLDSHDFIGTIGDFGSDGEPKFMLNEEDLQTKD